MSSRTFVAALLVVVGMVAYLLLAREGDGSSGSAARDEAGEAGARPSGSAEGTRPSGGARPSGSAEERFALRGRVEAEGQPVAGAVVTVLPATGGDDERHTMRTSADGRFEALALAPGRYAISATAAGHLPTVVRAHDLRADARLTLTLVPGGHPLRGAVSDATGGALEGALVRVTPLAGIASLHRLDAFGTLSADDGAYTIHVAPGRYRVDVSHPDYAPEHRTVEVGPGAQSQDFALVPMGVIEGVVRHESGGHPVPGAWVSWQRERQLSIAPGHRMAMPAGGGKTRADDQGRFTLRGLAPGAILLQARASAAASDTPTVVPLAMAEHVAGVEVLVSAALDVRGRVVAKHDPTQGIADAEVRVGLDERFGASARTDAEGRFVLTGVLEGPQTLLASASGWLEAFPGTAVEVGPDLPEELVLALERAPTIRGRVEPPMLAEVSIELRPETMQMGMHGAGTIVLGGGAKTDTDADGHFELGPAIPGHATVVARVADGRAGEATVDVGPDGADEVVIRLEPRSTVRGSVVSASGQPVAQASVSLRRRREAGAPALHLTVNGREMGTDAGSTTEDGRFEIGGVAAGDFDVTVVDRYGEPLPVRGTPAGTAALAVIEGKDVEDLALVVDAPDGVIRGVVHTAEGEPMPDVWVQATLLPDLPGAEPPEPAEGGPSERREMRMVVATADEGGLGSNARPPVLTDDEGRFAITGLRDAAYELVVESGGGGRRASAIARPGDDVTLALAELGSIEGVVTLDGQPLQRFAARVEGPTSRNVAVRNASGHFEIDRLDPGRYRLVITSAEGSGRAELTLEAGQNATQDVVLEHLVKVTGRIVDSQGAPIEDAAILLGEGENGRVSIEQDGSEPPNTTDADGRFEVRCAAGPRALIATAPGNPQPLVVHFFVAQAGQDVDVGELKEREPPAGMRQEQDDAAH
jgi:Carboxypeptidase regulatory-like domain